MASQNSKIPHQSPILEASVSVVRQNQPGRDYQTMLENVDREVLGQFQKTIASLRLALWFKAGVYLLQLTILSIALFWSLNLVQQASPFQPWVLVIALVSLLLLGILSFRNPVKMINHALVDLARIQIVLQGCSREFSQVDAAFAQALEQGQVDQKYLKQSAEHIQKIIDGNIESLLQFMEELHF